MLIDIIFVILVAAAVFKGLSKGFVIAVFSFLAIIIGLAAAMKLSYIVTGWLKPGVNTSGWLPFLSFIIVLLVVILIVRLAANIIQRAINLALLGWLNKLTGIAFFLILYLCIYSVILFYMSQMHFIQQSTISASHTYTFIEPFGRASVNFVGTIMPFLNNSFKQLSDFFSQIAQKHDG